MYNAYSVMRKTHKDVLPPSPNWRLWLIENNERELMRCIALLGGMPVGKIVTTHVLDDCPLEKGIHSFYSYQKVWLPDD